MAKSRFYDELPFYDRLRNKIQVYYQTIWKEKWREGIEEEWLGNFKDSAFGDYEEYRESEEVETFEKFEQLWTEYYPLAN